MISQQTSNEAAGGVASAEREAPPIPATPAPATKPLPNLDNVASPAPNNPPDAPPRQAAPPSNAPPRLAGPPYYGPPRPVGPPYGPPYGPATFYGPPVPPPQRQRVPWYVWLIGAILAVILVIGLIIAAAIGIFVGVLTNVFNGPQVTSSSSRTFTVSGMPRIVVNNVAGNVTIVSGPNNQVKVEITKKARDSSQSAAQSDLNRFNISLTQNENTVQAMATGDWNTTIPQQFTADLRITVPSTTALDLTQQAGTISINGITGNLAASVNAGTLDASNVTITGSSRVSVTTGTATIDGALSDGAVLNVTVTTGSARLHLPASTATHLNATASVGNITINGWSIPISRQGAGASAVGDLNPNPTSTLTIGVTTGDIQLSTK